MMIIVDAVSFVENIITLEMEPLDTIEDVKAEIQHKRRFPPDIQTLFFGEKQLRDERSLRSYRIGNRSKLKLFVKFLRGKYVTNGALARACNTHSSDKNISFWN